MLPRLAQWAAVLSLWLGALAPSGARGQEGDVPASEPAALPEPSTPPSPAAPSGDDASAPTPATTHAPSPGQDAPPAAAAPPERFPPPDFAFVVFMPSFRVASPGGPAPASPEAGAAPATPAPEGDGGEGELREDDPTEGAIRADAPPRPPVDPAMAELAGWLEEGVADALHAGGRYYVVELEHLPQISTMSAAQIWDGCTDELGCLTLLGDRARARVSLGVTVSPPEGGVIPVKVRIYDLDWGEEVEGLDLRLPYGSRPAPAVVEEATPGPEGEGATPAPTPTPVDPRVEAVEALTVALDARLLPLTVSRVEVVAPEKEGGAPAPKVDQATLDAQLKAELDALAAQPDEEEDAGALYGGERAVALRLDEGEREMLGLTPEQYVRYKRAGWTEAEWRERKRGRTGHVALRAGLGPVAGEVGQLYDGVLLLGDVTTEVVEKYARLVPAFSTGLLAQGGVAVGILPDLEVELRGGFTRSESTARTTQEFAERYPCEESLACPKVEVIPTRVATVEGLVRSYARRPWLLRPYASAGGQVLRMQDIPDAYRTFSSATFPTAYDAFPPLWTLGVTGAVGATWEVGPGAHFYAEIPLYLRLLSTAYEPLHYYASAPMVEEPDRPFPLPLVVSARVGLHVEIVRGK